MKEVPPPFIQERDEFLNHGLVNYLRYSIYIPDVIILHLYCINPLWMRNPFYLVERVYYDKQPLSYYKERWTRRKSTCLVVDNSLLWILYTVFSWGSLFFFFLPVLFLFPIMKFQMNLPSNQNHWLKKWGSVIGFRRSTSSGTRKKLPIWLHSINRLLSYSD